MLTIPQAVKLVAADALLARRHHEHRLQPMAHWDVAALEYGADLDGEGLAALVAFVGADPGALAAYQCDQRRRNAGKPGRWATLWPRLRHRPSLRCESAYLKELIS
jgi:hypothetical protein